MGRRERRAALLFIFTKKWFKRIQVPTECLIKGWHEYSLAQNARVWEGIGNFVNFCLYKCEHNLAKLRTYLFFVTHMLIILVSQGIPCPWVLVGSFLHVIESVQKKKKLVWCHPVTHNRAPVSLQCPATSPAWPPLSLLELELLLQRLWEGRSCVVDYLQVEEPRRYGWKVASKPKWIAERQ